MASLFGSQNEVNTARIRRNPASNQIWQGFRPRWQLFQRTFLHLLKGAVVIMASLLERHRHGVQPDTLSMRLSQRKIGKGAGHR